MSITGRHKHSVSDNKIDYKARFSRLQAVGIQDGMRVSPVAQYPGRTIQGNYNLSSSESCLASLRLIPHP